MGLQSLRDKLLQAGLVTEDQAKKAEADLTARKQGGGTDGRGRPGGPGAGHGGGPGRGGPKNAHQARGGPSRPQQPKRELTEDEKRIREEEAAFREKERLLNRERDENRKRASEDRKKLETLRTLCEKFEVTERGDEAFHFTSRKKRVMRIYLTPEQLQALEAGQLAIMDKPLPGELATALVKREAAEEVVRLDSRALRFYNRGGGETYGFKADAPLPGEEAAAESEATPAEAADDAPPAAASEG